ncbi:hypothetical protein DFQ29_004517 [Apophysomyces sp. BC1021]|nr:hypothetical protein DFQ29_004517 [Apophysomyces sp. BC1021]
MACAHNILLVGGFTGEYACRRIDDTEGSVQYGMTTDHHNGIANHIDIVAGRSGGIKGIISSNDQRVRCMDLNTMTIEKTLDFPFAINCSALSPDGTLLCIVGDATETSVVDPTSGAVVLQMDDHIDFSFACCWHPNGRMFATGNQDKTTRIYDIRYASKAVHVLGAKAGAIRSLKYSSNGAYLAAAAEHIDFVHVYDTTAYESSQVIDMFGEISGISFTPDNQALYVANTDEQVG